MYADERKLATVLFADLVGSTLLAGDQDPERTRLRLERFYDAMAAEVEGSGGTVEKFAGDAVMAAFGAPVALEDHAERALHAALAMRRRLEELFGGELALRVGVNTGELVVGRARESSSFVSGDAVNVAARLEQAAEPGQILVGSRTAAAARGAFEFGAPLTIEAKGKPEGIDCRPLLRALSLMRPRGFGGLGRVFVGREAELETLRQAYADTVDSGAPKLVTLVGDSGAGKTAIVRELWEWLGGLASEPLRRTGRCLAYGRAVTYWPLAEALREHFELLESDPADEALRRFGDRGILGLTLGLDAAEGLHPLAARDRLQEAWVDLLEELSADRQVVILIEDVHWAEEPLLDLLDRLHRDVRGPLLLVCTARPELLERRGAWERGALRIEPLGEAAAGQLVDRLLEQAAPDWVREFVVERAEGNPFFAEELLRTLIDQGLLERAGESWTGELPGGFTVPDSVRALVAARVDLLGDDEKAALQAAAVIGRIFWSGPVYELLEGRRPDLRRLEDRDFVRRRPGSGLAGEREYAFKHAVTREVAYGSLPTPRRARLHAAFARWLERTGEGHDEHAALLAHHYAEAVRPEDVDLAWPQGGAELDELRARAVAWLRRAAELATGRYELDDALALLQRAVELEPGDPGLWRQLGKVDALRFDGEAFWTAMLRALELEPDPGVRGELYAELAFQTTTRTGAWRALPDRELVRGWIEHALESTPRESPARARALLAQCFVGELGAAGVAEAAALAERLGEAELRSYAFEARSMLAFKAGRFSDALDYQQRRFDLSQATADPDHLHDLYLSLIPVTAACGHFREARRLARANDELSARLSAHHRMHGVACRLEVEELLGSWKRIRELEDRTLEAVRENEATPCIRNPRSLLVAALARAQLGDAEGARRLEEAAAAFEARGFAHSLGPPLIRLALLRGRLDEVERHLAAIREVRRQVWFHLSMRAAQLDGCAALRDRRRVEETAPGFVVSGTYLEPFALRALGIVRDDEELVGRALQRFEALGLDWHAAETRRLVLEP